MQKYCHTKLFIQHHKTHALQPHCTPRTETVKLGDSCDGLVTHESPVVLSRTLLHSHFSLKDSQTDGDGTHCSQQARLVDSRETWCQKRCPQANVMRSWQCSKGTNFMVHDSPCISNSQMAVPLQPLARHTPPAKRWLRLKAAAVDQNCAELEHKTVPVQGHLSNTCEPHTLQQQPATHAGRQVRCGKSPKGRLLQNCRGQGKPWAKV